jgi:hypothetical protein
MLSVRTVQPDPRSLMVSAGGAAGDGKRGGRCLQEARAGGAAAVAGRPQPAEEKRGRLPRLPGPLPAWPTVSCCQSPVSATGTSTDNVTIALWYLPPSARTSGLVACICLSYAVGSYCGRSESDEGCQVVVLYGGLLRATCVSWRPCFLVDHDIGPG